ncbi:MAG: hypothetical protein GX487_09315 [Acetomicrobium flavidum]|uniref:hypothetical protein n=1 Tax=Acetomicrobium flavidum TaxID=49896 RepID=UPI0016ADA50E|nr:hypothetical protein [Acetomicrobium flavidum]
MWKMLLVWLLFALAALLVHFICMRFVLKQRREDGKLLGRSDFVFRDNRFVMSVAFLWLMLSSMAFEGTFVWVLPMNVVLIALVVSMSFGLLLKDIHHSWSRMWTLLLLALWVLGYLTVFVTLDTLDFTQLAVLSEKGAQLYNVFPIPMVFMLLALLLPFGSGADSLFWRSFLVTFLSVLWVHTFFFSIPFYMVLILAVALSVVCSFVGYVLQKVLES